MDLKKYTRLKKNTCEKLTCYTVIFKVAHQSFELNYAGSKEEAEWMRGQLVKALEHLIKLEGKK